MSDGAETKYERICEHGTQDARTLHGHVQTEMEYDGGWLNFAAGLVCAVAGVTFDILGDSGIIDKDTASACSAACTVASVVLSVGTIGTLANVNAVASLGKTMYSATRTTRSVMSATKASICCDAASYTYTGFRYIFGFKW